MTSLQTDTLAFTPTGTGLTVITYLTIDPTHPPFDGVNVYVIVPDELPIFPGVSVIVEVPEEVTPVIGPEIVDTQLKVVPGSVLNVGVKLRVVPPQIVFANCAEVFVLIGVGKIVIVNETKLDAVVMQPFLVACTTIVPVTFTPVLLAGAV
jgi:hypothetical protein